MVRFQERQVPCLVHCRCVLIMKKMIGIFFFQCSSNVDCWHTAGLISICHSRVQRFNSVGAVLMDVCACETEDVVSRVFRLVWGIWLNCNDTYGIKRRYFRFSTDHAGRVEGQFRTMQRMEIDQSYILNWEGTFVKALSGWNHGN